jgi:hypothetical protein
MEQRGTPARARVFIGSILLERLHSLVSLIYTADIPLFWNQLKPFYEDALSYGDGSFTLNGIYTGLCEGTHYALAAWDGDSLIGSCVLRKAHYQTGENVIEICLLASKPNRFKDWCNSFEDVGLKIADWLDCDIVELKGRPGWFRALKTLGFVQEGEKMRLYGKQRRR